MKLIRKIAATLCLTLLISCGDKGLDLPDDYEVVWNEGNIFFVYLGESLRGKKTNQRKWSLKLCNHYELKQCQVYMWSKRDIIPKGLPIRNEGSFVHSVYTLKANGKQKYSCKECN